MEITKEQREAAALVHKAARELNSAVRACSRLGLHVEEDVLHESHAASGVRMTQPVFFVKVSAKEVL